MNKSLFTTTQRGRILPPTPNLAFLTERLIFRYFHFVSIVSRNLYSIFASYIKRTHLTTMKTLLLTLIFSSALYAQPSFTTPEDITVHDADNNGFAVFDLTKNSAALLDEMAPDKHKITYHLTFNDADHNSNPIKKPKLYTNTIQYSQELYARVTDIDYPTNYTVELFTIQTHNSPALEMQALRQ